MFNLKKCFLAYYLIVLLKQKKDIFGLISAKNKLLVIQILLFSKLLKQLEYYLEFKGYLN